MLKHKTTTTHTHTLTHTLPAEDNGFNPIWNEGCEFEIFNPELALIRFVAQDEDVFGDPNFIGTASFPITSLRSGFRSVPLRNQHNEELELSTLLVHVEIRSSYGEDEELYTTVRCVGVGGGGFVCVRWWVSR